MSTTNRKSIVIEGDKAMFASKGAVDRLKRDLREDNKERLNNNDYLREGWTYKILSNTDTEMKIQLVHVKDVQKQPRVLECDERRKMLKEKLKLARMQKLSPSQLKLNLKEGDKITVEGKIDFYSTSGKLNFIIEKLVNNEGIGELQKKYDLIKNEFEKKGYFDKSKKKKIEGPIKNILVLTSESGAAYQDFIFGLENGGSKVNINLIDVIVQGIDCPKNICNELEKLKKNNKQ
jgi:hypothetical protein